VPRSPKNNQQIRDARRDSILRAALGVFAEKGFSFTKISDIATAAGLSHGLVYHYFPSKEAIFATLIEEMVDQFEEDLDEEGATACERLERTLETSFGRMQESPEAMQLMTQAMLIGGLPGPLRACAFERAQEVIDRMVALVRECQEEGDVVDGVDAEQLTSVLTCVMRGMSVRPPGGEAMPMTMPTVATLMKLLQPSTKVTATRTRAPSSRGREKTNANKKA
jgi:AcrR family transcriptional regulator